jgi:hypothetical protein
VLHAINSHSPTQLEARHAQQLAAMQDENVSLQSRLATALADGESHQRAADAAAAAIMAAGGVPGLSQLHEEELALQQEEIGHYQALLARAVTEAEELRAQVWGGRALIVGC